MAIKKINYEVKIANQGQTPNGKFFYYDANEIKDVVNTNADELSTKTSYNRNETISGLWRFQNPVGYSSDLSNVLGNNDFVTKTWVLNNIPTPPSVNLQLATNEGNSTTNVIQITGNDNPNLGVESLYLGLDDSIGIIGLTNTTLSIVTPSIQFDANGIILKHNYNGTSNSSTLNLRDQTSQNAGAIFNSRVSGSNAVNATDFVTKAQLDAAGGSYSFENGLRETNGIVKLGLDPTTLGTTNIGALTEDTYLLRGDVASNNYSLIQIQTNDILVGGRTTDIGSVTIQQSGPNNIVSSIRLSDNDLVLGFGQTGGNARTITFGGASNAGIEIIDQYNLGLTYNANYYANGSLNDRWIPDWGAVKLYVDNSGGSSYIFENGLRESNNTVKLGLDISTIGTTNDGILTEDTYLLFGDLVTSNYRVLNISPNSVMVGGKTTNNNNGLFTYVVANDQIYLQILRQTDVSAEEEQALNFGNPGTSSELISIKDTKENFGMKYENDYSPLGTTDDRWIPDYGAVKALVQNNTNYYDPELF